MQDAALGLRLSGESSAGPATVDGAGRPRRAAVLGRPIAHSLSPALHRAAYAALGLSGWTYEAIDCGTEELPALIAAAGPEWAGFSVTMPGKRVAYDVAAHRTEVAELVGAANTLLPGPDGWTATNTDVDGIIGALGPTDPAGVTVALLGAGGTAQAALVALTRMGADDVQVLVRDPLRTSELAATAQRLGVGLPVHTTGTTSAQGVLDGAGIVVSTLPAGAADAFAERAWRPGVVLLDAVYAGWPTTLARAVTSAGGRAVGGGEMLLHQAAEQVRLMTGRPAPLDAMRAALPPAVSGGR